MKTYGEVDVQTHIFLTYVIAGNEWSASSPGERALGTYWIGGWVDPRAGLDDVTKRKSLTQPGLEFRSLGLPAHSNSLYRLRYPGSDRGIIALFISRNRKTTKTFIQDIGSSG
jgi:hypothetical protein